MTAVVRELSRSNSEEAEWKLRCDMAAVFRVCARLGWNEQIGNHNSLMLPGERPLFMINPRGMLFRELTASSLIVCDLDGNVVEGHRGPTSEKQLHLAVLAAYPEIGATMHCHAKHVQMFAVTHQPIPAVVEEFDVYVGGDVECSDYEETGSAELAEEVARRVADRAAVVMANHGLFACGKTCKDTLHIASLVERTAEVVWGARALGPIVEVPAEIGAKYASYYRYGRTGKF